MTCLQCVSYCMMLTKWLPVLFVTGVLTWSYYAYVIQLCFFNVDDWIKRIFYLILYHYLLLLFVWSYFKTIFSPIKKPTPEFYLLDTEIYQMEISQSDVATKMILEKKAKDLPLLTRTNNGGIRYCDKCKCIKPDRAHHCSVCNACILKMDHHCPWVNNCVAWHNYKFFLLFLFYAVVYCFFIAATSLEYFIKFWNEIQSFQGSKFQLLFLFFISLMFGISIFTLFAYHIYLVFQNKTTLETFRAPVFSSTGLPDKNGFNITRLENFKQVFGDSYLKAFYPISTSTFNAQNYTELIRPTSKLNEASHINRNVSCSNKISDSKGAALTNGKNYEFIKLNPNSLNTLNTNVLKTSSSLLNVDVGSNNNLTNTTTASSVLSAISSLNKKDHLENSSIRNEENANGSNQDQSITVHTILNNQHPSITFASVFKHQELFKNQSSDMSSELIDSMYANQPNRTMHTDDSRDMSKNEVDKNSISVISLKNRASFTIESFGNSKLNDGMSFPTSIRQTIATTNAQTIGYPTLANESLLLNDHDTSKLSSASNKPDANASNLSQTAESNGEHVRIYMD